MNQPFPLPLTAGPASHPISDEDILALRRWVWRDGLINRTEAEAILSINAGLERPPVAWTDFFVEAIAVWLVDQQEPRGYVEETDVDWLLAHLQRTNCRQTLADLELLVRVAEKASSTPERLRTFAMAACEQAILAAGRVDAAQARLLRRLLFAPGSDRPAGVSAGEADLLFRLKDAMLAANNDPEWQRLFVQGVGNYLQGMGGAEPLSRDREIELERFMAAPSGGLGSFLSRMGRASLSGIAHDSLGGERPARDFEADFERAAAIDVGEQAWLDTRVNADGVVDEYERALLEFLAGR